MASVPNSSTATETGLFGSSSTPASLLLSKPTSNLFGGSSSSVVPLQSSKSTTGLFGSPSPITPRQLPKPTHHFDADNTVTLLVGGNQKEMIVHDNYISSSSAFFKTALQKAWVEGQTRIVRLPTEDVQNVAYYLDFIYTESLPTRSYTMFSQSDIAVFLAGTCLLSKLFVLGELLLDVSFRNATLRELVRFLGLVKTQQVTGLFGAVLVGVDRFLHKDVVEIIYQGTITSFPARRFVVDICLAFDRPEHWDQYGHSVEKNFLFDFAKASMNKLAQNVSHSSFRGVLPRWEDYVL